MLHGICGLGHKGIRMDLNRIPTGSYQEIMIPDPECIWPESDLNGSRADLRPRGFQVDLNTTSILVFREWNRTLDPMDFCQVGLMGDVL